MSLALIGIGSALPAHATSQDDALALARRLVTYGSAQDRLLPTLYRRTRVATRHTVLDGETGAPLVPSSAHLPLGPGTAARMNAFRANAGPLAELASRRALDDAKIDPERVTHLVTVSCTGAAAPGVDVDLIGRLALVPEVARTHVGFMGCYGALSGLRVARAFAEADPRAVVLIAAVELCSLHFNYGDAPDRLVANALFADGAAAAVGVAEAGESAWRVFDQASVLVPDSLADMTWEIGDHGFEMRLSSRVPELIEARVAPFLDAWLARLRLRREDVRSYAVHPGGPRILGAVEAGLGLDESVTRTSREVLAQHGNMSSPTLLFILERLRASRAPRPCVALGFGPGLVVEAALLG